MLKDENLHSINEIFLYSSKYCLNKCLNYKTKLSDFQKCIVDCQSFQEKKFEFMENYLSQLNNIIEGVQNELLNKEETNNINQGEDRYILPEHFYRSSELETIKDPKSSVGSLFGRNR